MKKKLFLENYLPFLMFRGHQLMTRRLHREMQAMGTEPAEGRILLVLNDCHTRSGLTVTEVTAGANLPQPTVSRWLKFLEDKGMVRRLVVSSDGRHTNFVLTPSGRRHAAKIVDKANKHQEKVLSRFAADDVEKLRRMLWGFLAEIEQD